ncbi:MAG TPA: Ku protein [Pirellulales bacterium]|jgi:DNA end-binding protein Ku|nr:Ku protein [Pirellulales bacterium]
MALRSSWQGHLRLSLVTVPVQAINAVTADGEGRVHLRQLHAACRSPIRYQKVCPIHGEVGNDEIVMGYEEEKGKFVIIEKEELHELREKSDKAIDIDTFTRPDQIDPMQFEGRTYYLVPDGSIGNKPYAVLLRALAANNCFGIGLAHLWGRERLVLIRAADGLLAMEMLHFQSEFREQAAITAELHLPTVTKEELRLASKLIDVATAQRFDLAKYEDAYAGRLKELIESKRGEKQIATPEAADESPVINLMDALRRSVAKTRQPVHHAARCPRRAKSTRRSSSRRRAS